MPSEYPFSGMDMLQNSMSQLINELRNVGSAIGQSARNLNTGIVQQSAQLQGVTTSFNAAAVGAATRVMTPSAGGGNMFAETFSSQFNKPSLWSRDLVAMTGLKQYEDMHQHEVQRYARQNLEMRGEKLGINAMRAGAFVMSFGSKALGPIGIAADVALGAHLKNVEQKQEWWGYLDKVGANNALVGRGAGINGGWSDAQLKDMSKWLSTQDRVWYKADGEKMKHEELQTTISSAEMQGYFHGTVDTQEFRNKVTKLVKDTKEIMKTMKMANDEAAALIGEMSYFGYKDAGKTIKEMNRTAAMTGLTFDEVKQYGMEYAKSTYDAFGADKDVTTNLLMKVLEKYEKKDQEGAQVEMKGIYKAASNQANQLVATKWDPISQRFVLDEEGMRASASMDPIQLMTAASAKMQQLVQASGGDMRKVGMALNDLQARGADILLNADPELVRDFALGTNMSAIKMSLETLTQGNPNHPIAQAMKKGGTDPRDWLEYLEPEEMKRLAYIYAYQQGESVGDALKFLQGNTPGMMIEERQGPRTLDEVSARWNADDKNPKLSSAFRNPGSQWQYMDTLKPDWSSDIGKPSLSPNDQKLDLLYPHAGYDVMTQILWQGVANNPEHAKEMEQLERRLIDVTGNGKWDNFDRAHPLIYALQTREVMTNTDANRFIRAQYRNLYEREGISTLSAYNQAQEFNVKDLQNVMLGKQVFTSDALGAKWQAKWDTYKEGMDKHHNDYEKYYNSLKTPMDRADFQAIEAAKRTTGYVRDTLKGLQEGKVTWSDAMWSEELAEAVPGLWQMKEKDMTDWQKSIKAGGEMVTDQLSSETREMLEKARKETNLDKYYTKLYQYSIAANKEGLSSNQMMYTLRSAEGENQKMGYGLPNAALMMVGALEAQKEKGVASAAIEGSPYAELFASPTGTTYLNMLADPSSNLSQWAKSGEEGAESVADIITRGLADEAKRSGGTTYDARHLGEIKELVLGTVLKSDKAQQDLAVEQNRKQNDQMGELKTSNIYLRGIRDDMIKVAGLAGASEGYALRVISYGEWDRGELAKTYGSGGNAMTNANANT